MEQSWTSSYSKIVSLSLTSGFRCIAVLVSSKVCWQPTDLDLANWLPWSFKRELVRKKAALLHYTDADSGGREANFEPACSQQAKMRTKRPPSSSLSAADGRTVNSSVRKGPGE